MPEGILQILPEGILQLLPEGILQLLHAFTDYCQINLYKYVPSHNQLQIPFLYMEKYNFAIQKSCDMIIAVVQYCTNIAEVSCNYEIP